MLLIPCSTQPLPRDACVAHPVNVKPNLQRANAQCRSLPSRPSPNQTTSALLHPHNKSLKHLGQQSAQQNLAAFVEATPWRATVNPKFSEPVPLKVSEVSEMAGTSWCKVETSYKQSAPRRAPNFALAATDGGGRGGGCGGRGVLLFLMLLVLALTRNKKNAPRSRVLEQIKRRELRFVASTIELNQFFTWRRRKRKVQDDSLSCPHTSCCCWSQQSGRIVWFHVQAGGI